LKKKRDFTKGPIDRESLRGSSDRGETLIGKSSSNHESDVISSRAKPTERMGGLNREGNHGRIEREGIGLRDGGMEEEFLLIGNSRKRGDIAYEKARTQEKKKKKR